MTRRKEAFQKTYVSFLIQNGKKEQEIHWYQRYLEAWGRVLRQEGQGKDRVVFFNEYLERIGRNVRLADFQRRQIVEAIEFAHLTITAQLVPRLWFESLKLKITNNYISN